MENYAYLQQKSWDTDVTVTDTEYIYRMKRPQGFAFSKDCQDYYIMALIIAGRAQYCFGEEKTVVQAGDILFIGKNTGYTARVVSKEPWEHIVIAFRADGAGDFAEFPVERVNRVHHSNRYRELFDQAFGVWSQCAFGYKIQTKALITQILFALLSENVSRHFGTSDALRSLKVAIDYMEQNYARRITVEELARLSGYSASHFTRMFRQVYDLSPIQFLNRLRIQHAKNLLRAEQYTLSEIANRCGFSSVYYFSRCFKQITGATPKKW